jgi:hypothetical protein
VDWLQIASLLVPFGQAARGAIGCPTVTVQCPGLFGSLQA